MKICGGKTFTLGNAGYKQNLNFQIAAAFKIHNTNNNNNIKN